MSDSVQPCPGSYGTSQFLGLDHGQRFAIFAEQDVVTELVALVGRARFGHAFRQGGEDVEFLDNLSGIFDVPARQGELLVDQCDLVWASVFVIFLLPLAARFRSAIDRSDQGFETLCLA